MGEMADMLLEGMWNLTDEDHMDGQEWYDTVGRWNRICRYCGRSGLAWQTHENKWRLHDQRGIHVCKVNPLNSQ